MYNQCVESLIFRKGLAMKNLLICCLSMFLVAGLCGVAAGANGSDADKAKEKTDRVEAARERGGQGANEAKAKAKEKAAEVAKDANEVKVEAEKKAKEKAKVASDAKDDAEREMKGKAGKVEKDAGKEAAKMEGKKDMEGQARGKGHMQQGGAREKQLAHEQDKHNSRVARLQRIREVAQQEGDTKAVERVDKLMASENDRFVKKTGKLEGKAVDAAEKAVDKKP